MKATQITYQRKRKELTQMFKAISHGEAALTLQESIPALQQDIALSKFLSHRHQQT